MRSLRYRRTSATGWRVRQAAGSVNAFRPRPVNGPVVGKPLLQPQIHIDRTGPAIADPLEERSIVHCKGRDAGFGHTERISVLCSEGEKLGAVIHAPDYAGSFPHGQVYLPASVPAFIPRLDAGIIPHMTDTFAQRIDKRLDATNQTPEAASKRAGRNRGYIRDLRRKKGAPKSDNLEDLAKALECSIDYLVGITDDPGVPPGTPEEEQAIPAAALAMLPPDVVRLVKVYDGLDAERRARLTADARDLLRAQQAEKPETEGASGSLE